MIRIPIPRKLVYIDLPNRVSLMRPPALFLKEYEETLITLSSMSLSDTVHIDSIMYVALNILALI